jgi:hypothetical protein
MNLMLPPRIVACVRLVSLLLLPIFSAHADQLSVRWRIAPGERDYVRGEAGVAGANQPRTERGLAYDAVTDQVLLVSRAGSPQIVLLNAQTGSDGSESGAINQLSLLDGEGNSVVSGGTFTLNMIAAAADGTVFAANLTTGTNANFRIYRWDRANPTNTISVAYDGNPALDLSLAGAGNDFRFGDTLAARGGGPDLQVVAHSRSGRYLLVFTPAPGEPGRLVPVAHQTDIPANQAGLGLALSGTNTVFTDAQGMSVRRMELVATNRTARTVTTYTSNVIPINTSAIGAEPSGRRIALVDTVDHTVLVYDLFDATQPIPIGDPQTFASTNPNTDGTGSAAVSTNGIFALDTNNGLLALNLIPSVEPPTFSRQPVSVSAYLGGSATLSALVRGTPPFFYQWNLNGTPIPNAIRQSLTLVNLTTARAGLYSVTVSNAAGILTSSNALLTVITPTATAELTTNWNILPGTRPYINQDGTQRGIAYNPVTTNLLVVSRTGSNQVVVLDATTGAERHRLRTTDESGANLITGGTLVLNQIGVAADGAVYAANLVTDGATGLRIYRWANDAPDTIPTVITVTDLTAGQRFGDTMAVRGAGAGTQIVFGSRSGRVFALVSIPDGATATTQMFDVPSIAAGNFGLSLAFGSGNSVWGASGGLPLIRATFDPSAGTAQLANTYTNAAVLNPFGLIGVDPANNRLAGFAFESTDNVQLLNISDLAAPLPLLDQEFLPVSNPNPNGTGTLVFGGGRLFVLNSNNGIHAYRVASGAPPTGLALLNPRWVGGQFLCDLPATPAGRTVQIQQSSTLSGFTTTQTYPGGDARVLTFPGSGTTSFYRALLQ